MSGDPFAFDGPLDAALANDPVPDLPADFADSIVAATQGRADPLPRARVAAPNRWRSTRRLAVGLIGAGALASAAAAAGLLDNLPVEIPTPQEVWSSITGDASDPASSPSAPLSAVPAELAPVEDQPVVIEGPIDTPEELEESFRRVDQVREVRRDRRQRFTDQRIDTAIERRREQGLPAPTPEREARLRKRIERIRENAQGRVDTQLEERRDALRDEIENGAELTAEEVIQRQRGLGSESPIADRMERLRQLPPAQRRAVIRRWRARQNELREQRLQGENEAQSTVEAEVEEQLNPTPSAEGEPAPDAADVPPETVEESEPSE